MRGKLRDKYDAKRERLKREIIGRRPSKRDKRNLHLPQTNENDDTLLDEEEELQVEKEQQN